jgi:hypothetical protein
MPATFEPRLEYPARIVAPVVAGAGCGAFGFRIVWGHRPGAAAGSPVSEDFDFFSSVGFDPDRLWHIEGTVRFLKEPGFLFTDVGERHMETVGSDTGERLQHLQGFGL